jgi:ABC-type sugar transport system ATPase subunit
MNFFDGSLSQQNGRLRFHERATNGTGFSVLLSECQSKALGKHLGKVVTLGLRPEHIVSTSQSAPHVPALLDRIEPAGAESLHYYSTGSHAFVARFPSAAAESIGEPALLAFETAHALFFDPATGLAISA